MFAGAGIVYDSNPISEYEETRNKAEARIRALKMVEGRIKMVWFSIITIRLPLIWFSI